jgi:hypothetical protein
MREDKGKVIKLLKGSAAHFVRLVYGITKGDSSGYNRRVQPANTKSKVGGAITFVCEIVPKSYYEILSFSLFHAL